MGTLSIGSPSSEGPAPVAKAGPRSASRASSAAASPAPASACAQSPAAARGSASPLGWAGGSDKPTLCGKEALRAERAAKSGPLATGLVVTGRGIPRSGCRVRSPDGTAHGVVTSGTMSPTLRQGIALALLARSAQEGDEVVIDVRGKDVQARVQRPPFVQPGVSG